MLSSFRRLWSAIGPSLLVVVCCWVCWTSSRLSANDQTQAVPAHIANQAVQLGIPLSSIKRQGDEWVACTSVNGNLENCIVLGQATKPLEEKSNAESGLTNQMDSRVTRLTRQDVLTIHQYGQPERNVAIGASDASFRLQDLGTLTGVSSNEQEFVLHEGVEARVVVKQRPGLLIDTLPRYRLEGDNLVRTKDSQLVRQYIDSHPSEAFMVLVTVPALCAPCRQLDAMIHQTLHSSSASLETHSAATGRMKTFILEYFSFRDAEQELLGQGAIFPTTLVYRPESQPQTRVSRFIGELRGHSIEEISQPLRDKLRRGTPHTFLRGVLSKDLFLSLRK